MNANPAANIVSDLEQTRFIFGAVQCPYRPLLTPEEAAVALGALWRDYRLPDAPLKRFNTRFIFDLLDRGELEGPRDLGTKRPAVEVRTKDGSIAHRKPRAAHVRISRDSLLAYVARHWSLAAEDSAQLIVNHARNLPVEQIKNLSVALAALAEKHSRAIAEKRK